MALIKKDSLIEFSGKIGGNVYKRDSSGYHVVSYPRKIKKEATEAQRRNRSWYAGKKREENLAPLPPEGYEEPKHICTATIFSLEVLWAHRTPSLFEPETKPIEYAGFYQDQILEWVNNNWNPNWERWGFGKDLMFFMTLKWWYVLKYIKFFSSDAALMGAKINMQAWISESAAAVAVPLLTLWAGLLVWSAYLSFLDWLEGVSGFISFQKGRVLIKLQSGLWWGQLVERPSKKMYDFKLISKTDFGCYTWHINPDTPAYMMNWIHLKETWATIQPSFPIWYVFLWQTIQTRQRGWAYIVTDGLYRLETTETQIEYWGHEIGWANYDPALLNYPNLLTEYFEYPGHPNPPL